jgi:small subunit ribosomal protein S16
MATKIRLQRHGRKKRPFYHIVVADTRAPRDGRFIEKIGTYNPTTNPATIDLDVNKATEWLLKGAEVTDTAGAILSYKGAKYKKHLQVGVNKGSISQEDADKKFAEWLAEKDGKVQSKMDTLSKAADEKRAAALKAETEKKEARAAKIAERLAAEEAANAPAEEVSEEAEANTEEASAEEAATANEEATAEAANEEAPAEEAPSEDAAE